MKKYILVLMALLIAVQQAAADENAVVQPKTFDDLNGDGISDTDQKPVVTSDPNAATEESVDAEQPIDPVSDGGEAGEGGEGGEGGSV